MLEKQGNNLPKVKLQNGVLIREAIYKYAPISRKEIAEMLNLTPPTITTNVANLIKQGLVKEILTESARENKLGRPSIKLDYVKNSRYAIGLDQAPTRTIVCITDIRGNIVHSHNYAKLSTEYGVALNDIVSYIETSMEKSQIDISKIMGIGISLIGLIDCKKGIIRMNKANTWVDKPIVEDLKKHLEFPLYIENNAKTRAICECLFSPNNLPTTFAYYFIANGIACPLIMKDSIYSGTTPSAGEIGQCVFEMFGAPLSDNNSSRRLDDIASEHSMRLRCVQLLKSGARTVLSDICNNPDEVTNLDILKAQELNDVTVNEIVKEAIVYLAHAISIIINFISPPVVMVDSQILAFPMNQEFFLKRISECIVGISLAEVKFIFLPHNFLRGAHGAAGLVIKAKLFSTNDNTFSLINPSQN